MNKLILFAVLCLVGCASTKPVVVPTPLPQTSPATKQPLEKAKETVNIDKELLKPCAEFSTLNVPNPTPNDVLKQKAADVAVRKDCALRHQGLVKIVKDAFNIRE